MRWSLALVALALVAIVPSAGGDPQQGMHLRLISETETTITLGWDPVPGAIGYRFQSAVSAPKWSHTWDATRTAVRFARADWYRVEAIAVLDVGSWPEPPPPTAAVAVAPSGNDSTCVRGDLAKPCATFRRAYEIAHCGDLVHVADGSYARQDLQGPDKSCSGGYVVFKGSRAAVVDEIKTAECCGRGSNGPDWIELNGFTLRNRLNGWGQADNWRVIGIDGGSFDINGPANWLLSGNDWGPCSSNTAPTCNGQNFAGGVSNLVIDGDTFHDFTITPGSGAHWECLFITGARGANVIRNSRFWNCETYGIYFSSFHSDHRYSTGSWTVENNWFGRTCCFGSSPRSSAINLGGSSPGEPVQNVLIRFNSFAPGQTLVREGGPTGSNLRAVGNIFGASGCVADVSYFYNLFRGGTCGQSGLTISEMPYVNGSDGAAMDYHLRSGSPAERYVAPTSSDYALAIDIDRQSRTAPRDAGSDEVLP